jgi:hypothetical protein
VFAAIAADCCGTRLALAAVTLSVVEGDHAGMVSFAELALSAAEGLRMTIERTIFV